MNVIEKRDSIHSCLHRAHESTINNFYEKLRQEEVLKGKLESREKNRRKIFNQGLFLTEMRLSIEPQTLA